MKSAILIILLSICSLTWSQMADSTYQKLFAYKWLNERIPLDTLVSYKGDTIELFKEAETFYVISFWSVYCAPCISEIPSLNQLKKDYSNANIKFISISYDSNEDVQSALKNHPFDFDLYYLDRKIIFEKKLTIGFPTNIIVNDQGIVLYQKSGGPSEENSSYIYDLLDKELSKLGFEK